MYYFVILAKAPTFAIPAKAPTFVIPAKAPTFVIPAKAPASSSRRKPGSILTSSFSARAIPPNFVIPAKAGIQLLALALGRCRDNRLTSLCLFSRHPWRASHFSLLAQREVTKRKGTRVPRPLSRVRCGRPGSADVPSMARSGIGAIHRADPSGLIVRPPPRHTGSTSKDEAERASLRSSGPLGRGECAEEKARRVARRMRASSLSAQGCAVSEPPERTRAVGRLLRPTAPSGVPFSLVTFSWASKRK